MKETTEYKLVKTITAEENRKAILVALGKVSLFMSAMYAGMYGFFYTMLWFNNLTDVWLS